MKLTYLIVASLLFSTAGLSSTTPAELPPGAYDSLRKDSHDAVVIEVDTVTTKELKNAWTTVIVTAKVLKVERSKSGLKKGQKITIEYKSYDLSKADVKMPGPGTPGILEKGEIYPAFLNKDGEQGFAPAAYAYSFSMTPEV